MADMPKKTSFSSEPRIIWCEQLIGSATVCRILGIDRSTLTRRIRRGELVPLAQLDGPRGAYVFDRGDFPV
ncbi:MAG: hypothetical protein B5766_12875 [Candidatus Lumbricidophila eiseniae]|uniref:Helix-turn-helix domain-containing protein n=1 Tax=Candidatus Lumbricidiphila eiseniae TaxID=1969409 RepID=A0A2A6FN66_9MICO|nr:MAG: hypothetical protein B5766_12875 [Candidatus Lumbricidophila eiseniae]